MSVVMGTMFPMCENSLNEKVGLLPNVTFLILKLCALFAIYVFKA